MRSFLNKIVRTYNQIKGLLSAPLPQGMTEFDAWIDRLMSTYTLPTSKRDDVLFVVGTAIMHLDPTTFCKPPYYFVKLIRATGAKQIAGAAFQGVKQRQQAAQAAAQAEALAKSAEVTAIHAVASSGPEQS